MAVLEMAVGEVAAVLGVELASILELLPDGQHLTPRASMGGPRGGLP